MLPTKKKSTIGNDIMLALGHEVHILIAIFALVPVDNLEINSKFLHKRIAPRWFVRKYIENRIIYSIFYLFYSLAIIILITNTVIWKFQVITSADMYTNRIVPMHFVSCINIFYYQYCEIYALTTTSFMDSKYLGDNQSPIRNDFLLSNASGQKVYGSSIVRILFGLYLLSILINRLCNADV